jgi:putative FmdB family regulatory protein
MPTYDYECSDCGHRFERFQNMSDRPVRKCPRCGGKVRRLIGTGGAVLMRGGQGETRTAPTRCGRDATCCGREVPCDRPPCES